MTAVLGQLVLPLLLAFGLGLGMGWLTWRWRRTRVARAEWEALVERASYGEVNQEVLKAERDSAAKLLRSLRVQMAEVERGRDLAKAGQTGAQAEIVRLMGERRTDASKIEDLERELLAARSGTDGEKESAETTLADRNSQLDTELAAELATTTEALEVARAALADLEAERAVSAARAEELRAQLDSAQNRAVETVGQLAEIEVRKAELEAAARAGEARISELEAERDNAVSERDSAVSERDDVWTELDSTITAHEQALAVLKQHGLEVNETKAKVSEPAKGDAANGSAKAQASSQGNGSKPAD